MGEAAIFATASLTDISFLWFNVIGAVVVIVAGNVLALFLPAPAPTSSGIWVCLHFVDLLQVTLGMSCDHVERLVSSHRSPSPVAPRPSQRLFRVDDPVDGPVARGFEFRGQFHGCQRPFGAILAGACAG